MSDHHDGSGGRKTPGGGSEESSTPDPGDPFDDLPTDAPGTESLPDVSLPETIAERVASDRIGDAVATRARDGTLAMAVGAVVLWRAVRSARGRPIGAIVQAAIGAGAIAWGARLRRRSDSRSEVTTDPDEKVSDEAHEAAHRADLGRQPEFEPDGTVRGERGLSDPESIDVDEPFEDIDLSSSALADEPGEATGPTDEQAQPTRTDETEQDLTSGPVDHGEAPEAEHLEPTGDDESESETDDDSGSGAGDRENGGGGRQDETDPDAPQADSDDPEGDTASEADEDSTFGA